MAKFCQKLIFTTASVVLSLAVLEATSTHAVVLTYNFTVNITSGSLLGQEFEGFFSYDDSAIEESQLTPVLSFSFDFLGNTYTETDGVSVVPNFELETVDYTGLNLFKVWSNPPSSPISAFSFNPNGYSFYYWDDLYNTGYGLSPIDSYGSVAYALRSTEPQQDVPEPQPVVGLTFIGIGSWLLKRTKQGCPRQREQRA